MADWELARLGLDEAVIPHVVEAQALPGSRLWLRFETGETRVFDAAPYLEAGRYRLLKNPLLWGQVSVRFGTVEWPQGLDFDPEDLYSLSIPVEL